MPAWAATPEEFWRAADTFERKNGVSLRQITISLPNVMTLQELISLAREITMTLAGNKPFQMAVHIPIASLGDVTNPHVHIAICDRIPDGIERPARRVFARYNSMQPEKGGWRKDSGGLTPTELRRHVLDQRYAVAELQNDALARNGHSERVDPRSLKEQGIIRRPERHLGQAAIRRMTPKQKRAIVAKRRER